MCRGTGRGGEGEKRGPKSGCQQAEPRGDRLWSERVDPVPCPAPKGQGWQSLLPPPPTPIADTWLISGWGWVTPGCLHQHQPGALGVGKHITSVSDVAALGTATAGRRHLLPTAVPHRSAGHGSILSRLSPAPAPSLSPTPASSLQYTLWHDFPGHPAPMELRG